MRHSARPHARRTAAELGTGLAAAVALAAAVVGLPILLYTVAGIPIPHHAPSPGQITHALTSRDNGQLFLSALLVIAWAGWVVFTLSFTAEAVALIRGRAAIRLPGCALSQQLAGALLAAVAVLLVTTAPSPGRGTPQNTAALLTLHVHNAVIATATGTRRVSTVGHPEGVPPVSTRPAPAGQTEPLPTYTVRRGDTLWAIAEAHLGDPERWAQIARLNYDRPQPDGRALTNSHWIYPGWQLRLPADATNLPTADQHPQVFRPEQRPPQPSGEGGASPAPPPRTTLSPSPDVTPSASRESGAARSSNAVSVTLPSGSEVGAAFLAGVLAAMTTVRLRHRRSYRPAPPGPADVAAGSPPPVSLPTLLRARRARDDDADTDELPPAPTVAGRIPCFPVGVVEIGIRDGAGVPLALADWPGLALSGPSAEGVVRAWLAALITGSGPYGADIVGSATTLGRVFPRLCSDLPALRIVNDDHAVLTNMETEVVRRTRLLEDAEVADAVEHRSSYPADPLPVTVAVLDGPELAHASRWNLIAVSAGRLGMSLIVLDPQARPADGPHIAVQADGTVHAAQPPELHDALAGSRLFTLTPGEAVTLLTPVVAAHRQPEERAETHSPVTATRGVPSQAPDVAPTLPPPTASVTLRSATPQAPRWPAPATGAGEAPLVVCVFGPLTVRAWGRDIDTGLRESARELLAWYLLHPDGAPAEAAVDALWPDAPAERGPQRFWTALGNLRTRLRGPNGEHLDVLAKTGDVYRPQAQMLDVDLWRFQNALDLAGRDEAAGSDALATAADLYRGDFAATADYLWAEPIREELHRRALDTHIRLAEYYDEAGAPDAAIAALERAIVLDPVAEEVYRRIIRLLGRAGRRDAVNRYWAQLQGRLADIDLDPEPSTASLVRKVQTPEPYPQRANPSRRSR